MMKAWHMEYSEFWTGPHPNDAKVTSGIAHVMAWLL